MTKLKSAFVVAIVAAGIVTPLVLLFQTNAVLRKAQREIFARDQRLEELRRENQRLVAQAEQPLPL